MDKHELEVKLKALLAGFFHCEEASFHSGTNFIEDFEIDSLGVLMLICLLEEAFEIKNGDPSKYYELVTYEKALEYLHARCSAAS